MTPTKESGGWKFSSSSQLDLNEVRTNQQIPYKIDSLQGNGLGNEETLAFPKNFSPNPNAESECLQCLSMYGNCTIPPKRPPVAPFASCQLRTKCFDSRNVGTKWESVSLGFGSLNAAKRAKRQLAVRDQWPATCFVDPGPKLQEMESLIWPQCILWTN